MHMWYCHSNSMCEYVLSHDDVMVWKPFRQHWPFVDIIRQWLVDPFNKEAAIRSFVSPNQLLNNQLKAGDLKSDDVYLMSLQSCQVGTPCLCLDPTTSKNLWIMYYRSIMWIHPVTPTPLYMHTNIYKCSFFNSNCLIFTYPRYYQSFNDSKILNTESITTLSANWLWVKCQCISND